MHYRLKKRSKHAFKTAKILGQLPKKKVLKLSSHYKIFKSTKGRYYSFKTKNGGYYQCFFTIHGNKHDLIGLKVENSVYHFSFFKKRPKGNLPFDVKTGNTVAEILNRFFLKYPTAIICYICENNDSKAVKRQLSFEKWFESNNCEPKKTLIKGEIAGLIYAGAVMVKQHPEKTKIKNHFDKELNEILTSQKSGSVDLIE